MVGNGVIDPHGDIVLDGPELGLGSSSTGTWNGDRVFHALTSAAAQGKATSDTLSKIAIADTKAKINLILFSLPQAFPQNPIVALDEDAL